MIVYDVCPMMNDETSENRGSGQMGMSGAGRSEWGRKNKNKVGILSSEIGKQRKTCQRFDNRAHTLLVKCVCGTLL